MKYVVTRAAAKTLLEQLESHGFSSISQDEDAKKLVGQSMDRLYEAGRHDGWNDATDDY